MKKDIIFLSIIYRQLYLSIGRFPYEKKSSEFFFKYFMYKKDHYNRLLKDLEKSLEQRKSLSIFTRIRFKICRIKTLNYFELLLCYKIVKEFIIFLDTEKHDYNLAKGILNSSGMVFWKLLYPKLNSKEKNIIEEIECFGQNEFLNQKHYSIEEALSLLIETK